MYSVQYTGKGCELLCVCKFYGIQCAVVWATSFFILANTLISHISIDMLGKHTLPFAVQSVEQRLQSFSNYPLGC